MRGVLNADGDGIASGLGRSEAFGLDGLGNWRTYGVDTDGNGTNDLDQTRVHNEVNEIDTTDDHGDAAGDAIAATTGSNWIDPVYDASGNMTQGPQPQNPLVAGTGETVRLHYAYDAWNRMVGVYADSQGQPGTVRYTYGYDGLHRRVRRSKVTAPTWYYHNESWQVLEEQPPDGAARIQYVWDIRYIDAAVVRDLDLNGDGDCTDAATGTPSTNEGDEHLYYTQDANFNVTSLVDVYDGAVVERYGYDPYGKPMVLEGVRDWYGNDTSESQWQPRTSGAYENELLYCGYRYDPWHAGHYHVRHRVYHPTLGRWTARDPIGYGGGPNSYEVVSGSPACMADELGLAPKNNTGASSGAKKTSSPSCSEVKKCFRACAERFYYCMGCEEAGAGKTTGWWVFTGREYEGGNACRHCLGICVRRCKTETDPILFPCCMAGCDDKRRDAFRQEDTKKETPILDAAVGTTVSVIISAGLDVVAPAAGPVTNVMDVAGLAPDMSSSYIEFMALEYMREKQNADPKALMCDPEFVRRLLVGAQGKGDGEFQRTVKSIH